MIQKAFNQIIPTALFKGEHGTELDKKAICFFVATGFFFENDTYWKNARWSELDFDNQPWKYEPRDISLTQAVDEFAELFHQIVEEQTRNQSVILPLSGGLDSRSMAAALHVLGKEAFSYSYKFQGSFKETWYGEQIAKTLGWAFEDITIPPGYMWDKIEASGKVNGCYSEFTHARQISVAERLSHKGDVWLLGHWGDVLFDDMGVDDELPFEAQVKTLEKKVFKKGGKELAEALWKAWNLPGDFAEELAARVNKMHGRIDIENANARIRAFKSLYWATRWTSTNLVFFEQYKPLALPFYDDRMCQFMMTVPEKHLAARQIQIEYIKKYAPELAKIPWQSKAPYNLYNYHKFLTPAHLPYRIANKTKHVINDKLFGKKLIQRNWEIQFIGDSNEANLKQWLFNNEAFTKLVPQNVVKDFYQKFKTGDGVYWSHPLSMLLTLSVFAKTNHFKA